MGRIEIQDGERTSACELSARTLVGRHWSANIAFHSDTVPQFWLEIRWRLGEWCWRPLSGASRTRGAGERRESEWRKLPESLDSGMGRIRCAETVWLRLVDPSPPRLFARDLVSRKEWLGDALDALIAESWDGSRFRRGALDCSSDALLDGDILSVNGMLLEIYPWSADIQTIESRLSVIHPKTTLDIDVSQLTATFCLEETEITLSGEPVRTLAVFALARMDDLEDESGWLTAEAAWEEWLELGGNPTSSQGRLGWDRGKLRDQLTRANALDVSQLFQVSRSSRHPGCRLNLSRRQITLSGLDV